MTSTTTQSDKFMADVRRAYRAEYERSPELQAEFVEAGDWAAYQIAQSPDLIARMREKYEATLNEAARQRAIRAGHVMTAGLLRPVH